MTSNDFRLAAMFLRELEQSLGYLIEEKAWDVLPDILKAVHDASTEMTKKIAAEDAANPTVAD